MFSKLETSKNSLYLFFFFSGNIQCFDVYISLRVPDYVITLHCIGHCTTGFDFGQKKWQRAWGRDGLGWGMGFFFWLVHPETFIIAFVDTGFQSQGLEVMIFY